MYRMLVISDIHGELQLFENLLDKVNYNPTTDQLILLGDYIDRGPDSCGILDKIMKLKDDGAITLMGNHEDMLISAFRNGRESQEKWWRNGAIHTLKSYDPKIKQMIFPKTNKFLKHINFIKTLDYYYETRNHIFVHGGVDPNESVDSTDPHTLMWIREKFYQNYDGKKIVVFGHTRNSRIRGQAENNDIYFGMNNIIGIDGGAVYGGQLNCLEIREDKYYQSTFVTK